MLNSHLIDTKDAGSVTIIREEEKRECPLCRYVVVSPCVRSCPRCNTSIPFEDPGCGSCIHAISCPSIVVQSGSTRYNP